MLRTGIVGLPNVGKSTLFNALTSTRNAQSANYPFCTIEPNVGMVAVPDERLWKLQPLVKTDKVVPTAIELVDIAGPLGQPTHIKKYGTVVCLAGGYGAAPCYLIAKAFKDAGNKVYMIMGARNKDLIFWQDKMQTACNELFITTDDGTIKHNSLKLSSLIFSYLMR